MDWSYFDKFERVTDKYLPARGEGENLATQITTAVSKLVYKWYNDGDVYDNTGRLSGWINNLSSYGNWLYKHTGAGDILKRIWRCESESDYEQLLADLADKLLDDEDLERESRIEKAGSIYDCEGPFEFKTYDDEEEEEDYGPYLYMEDDDDCDDDEPDLRYRYE